MMRAFKSSTRLAAPTKRGFGRMAPAILVAGLVMASFAFTAPAQAQSAECSKLQGMLQQRQALVAQLNSTSKKKQLTPQRACGILGQLVANGSSVMKFMDSNKDWCQIPDAFVENMKADNARSGTIRRQACNAASQQASNERKARQAQAQQQQRGAANDPFGGADAVTGGAWRVPQGAL
jgi:hypothetical protein